MVFNLTLNVSFIYKNEFIDCLRFRFNHPYVYASSVELTLFFKKILVNGHKSSSRSDLAAWTRLHDVSVFENIPFRVSTQIRSFGGSKKKKFPWKAVSKRCSFGERIHWIRENA